VRGDHTREALIDAAIAIFGRDGFGAASTRSIADAAKVNQALIGYHFGGKPGLYLAAFDRITRAVEQFLLPVAQPIREEMERGAADAQRCLDYVYRVMDSFISTFTAPESAAWARLILREQQSPSDAFDRMYERVMAPQLALLAGLVARIRNLDAQSVEVRVLVQTMVAQPLVFRSARATVLRHLGLHELGENEITTIRRVVRQNVTAMLTKGA
jgi:AcrR family transcriptional regulator